jgi:hypothetical protein
VNGAHQASAQAVISHAHARDLASCWEDAANANHPVTRLARTGEITPEAGPVIAQDLRLLESASATWGYPPSIPEKQLRVLLGYVRHHGPRAAVDDWHRHRDAEFLRSIRRMASEARSHVPPDDEPPAPVRQMPTPRRRG